MPVGGGCAWPGFETPAAAGVEGAGQPGRGAGGWRQGQGGPRDRPLRAEGSRVAISRAGRRPPAHTAPGTPAAPRATQQPGTAPAPRHTKNRHPDRMSACGGARGIRTPDLLIANETRYQLRHSPKDSNSLAPSQSAVQADHRRVRHDTEPTHATAPRARRPAARHQQLRGPYWARRASRTASRSRATA